MNNNHKINKQLSIKLSISNNLFMGTDSNPLAVKSYAFALKIVQLYKEVVKKEKEFVLSKQLLRAGTSIGANVSEANGAISKADFSAKISVAYKESLETKYWLHLLKDSDYVSPIEANKLIDEADELSKIMFAILKATRINKVK